MSDEVAKQTTKLSEVCLIGYFRVTKTPTFKIKAETKSETFLVNSFALSPAMKQRLGHLGKELLRCDKNEH